MGLIAYNRGKPEQVTRRKLKYAQNGKLTSTLLERVKGVFASWHYGVFEKGRGGIGMILKESDPTHISTIDYQQSTNVGKKTSVRNPSPS